MSSQITHAQDIADALGGIPNLAKAIGVPYRRAYGYVREFNTIPPKYDLKLVAALEAAGSEIDLLSLARWRAGLATNDKRRQPETQATHNCKSQKGAA